ncbi:MAG: glutathione S-transferase, partial [Betaproteobacteria bacterium]|nr:glutathione S-transferase [Betaproteobacteria bacterium]
AGSIWPDDPRVAADADRWMDWYHTTLWPNMGPVFWTLIRTTPEKRNMALVEESRQKLATSFGIVDAWLADRDYLAGKSFTMGDIPMGIAAWRWFELPIERPAAPNFERWYTRMCERPAYAKHCMLTLT